MTPASASRAAARKSTAQRRPVRARRVSGPARAGAAAAAVAIPASEVALPRPRPASKPRKRTRLRTVARPVHEAPGIALRAVTALERVADSSLLDRIIRGGGWIGLLAFALIGIVAMQLLVLKLNTGIGHSLEQAASLQREDAQLAIEDSSYSAESRVAPLAADGGMSLAAPGSIHFLLASPADVKRAGAILAEPLRPRESASAQAVNGSSQQVSSTTTAESTTAASTTAEGAAAEGAAAASTTGEGTSGSTDAAASGSATEAGATSTATTASREDAAEGTSSAAGG